MSRLLSFFIVLFVASLLSLPTNAQDEEQSPPDSITSMTWTYDGAAVAVARLNGMVEIYTSDGILEVVFQAHDSGIEQLAWSHDDQRLASAGWDRHVRIWTPAGKSVYVSEVFGSEAMSVAWNPTDDFLFVGTLSDDELWKADISTDTYTFMANYTHGTSAEIAWSLDGTHLAFSQTYGEVLVYDADSMTQITSFGSFVEGDDLIKSTWHPDGESIAVALRTGHVVGWSLDGEKLYDLKANRGEDRPRHYTLVRNLQFSQDGNQLIAVSFDGTVRVWETKTFEVIAEAQLPDPLYTAAINPDGTKIAYVWLASALVIDDLSTLLKPVP